MNVHMINRLLLELNTIFDVGSMNTPSGDWVLGYGPGLPLGTVSLQTIGCRNTPMKGARG